ncbi:atrial natriuretic peptide receptor 1-like isoform X2 [Mya arenaria]|uniref:atrial natriuretic peptide receptor 1-like isoform X2 n=1 Tax=Mya arenaria TaxID=6604 RepID=UPI0022E8A873|nr:atrial natriuretic peptide receptor 1-like isoform X2 [Mya arenaria]
MYSMVDLCFVWIVSLTMSMNVAKCENRTDLGFTQETNVTIAVFAPEIDGYDFSLSNIIPAVELAVEEQTKKLPKNIRLRVTYHDSHYGQEYPLEVDAIRLIDSHKAQVFIGPIGDAALNHVARISAHENFPIISPGGLHINFGLNKTDYVIYQTLIRIGPKFNRLIGMLIHVLVNVFSFQKIKIISQKHNAQNTNLCKAVHDTALDLHKLDYDTCKNFHENIDYLLNLFKNKHSGNSSNIQFDFYLIPKRMNVTDILVNEIGTNYGVVVLCASADSVREIMIKAHELNFDNGEYVFFSIDLFSSKNESTKPWYRENDTQERNEKAKKAYEALMTVTLRKPTSPEYKNFSREVKRRAKSRYENFTYGEEEVNSFVGAFHDAVILYALALNETLQANRSITNGTEITRRMWNRTFRGITGNVSIDDNGDRNADYSLLDMDPVTGEFEVVANYFGNTKRYEQVDGKSIRWAGGLDRAPPDTPKCGFDNSKCPPDKPFPEYGIVIIVLGSLLLIVVVAAFFIYRHIKLEAELAEMNWRVKWEDIMLGTIEGERKMKKQAASNLSLARRYSVTSSCSRDTIAVHLSDVGQRQLFTKTGYYKGAIVAIKSITRTNIAVNKPLLMEIKRIKDLASDHIVRFIGACIDYPHMCILTEYCQKGSLQDVLENEQIKLDWMFRYSLMQDIVRAMTYLQSTEVKSHGALKSTNCVVDSRFVLKLTDFGLHDLRGHDEEMQEGAYAHYRGLQWTAPELLRMHNRPLCGTQRGDVYSFAIICQEIVYRSGVFYVANIDVGPQEVVERVKSNSKPPFRPTLEEFDCPCDELADVIRRCWSEDPVDRPDFSALKSIIRKLNKDGDKGNILDNLLSRMEQYANNLESLVEERTADFLEQKKKAEDLLYMMLPKQVAGQLIRGETVMPETFDSVTIYFSDICGFTALSSESTPMQVIDLLNDLYTTFDSIIENFDVYKVETIGDAYMVVSGLPVRNGNLHAREISRMSIALLNAVLSFRIRHKPNDQLKLRIGIHSGSVCAGVVGLKMPRYCLFGDTVNTASRMESNGLPLRIHVSPFTKEVLDQFGSFELELRGPVEMKGKGAVTTYWLSGERIKLEQTKIVPFC